jgi:phosphoesterase RecJ-like protein
VRLYKATRIEVDHDLLLILDAGDDTRAGIEFVRDAEKTVLVNIDHHSSNNFFGDLNIVDTKASSACEMIVALIDRAKDLELDKDNALSLLLGLTTDSRSFQNEGLRHTAHLAAAKLLATGVDNSPILNMLNSGRSETDLRVQGFGLTNFRLECDGALATLVITQKDLQKMNAKINNIFASGIFNILTSMKKTLASVVIFEREDGMSFCEFRSRSGIDVKEVAVKMGGGGHIPASGCSKNEAIEKVAQEAVMLMKDQVTKSLKGKRN